MSVKEWFNNVWSHDKVMFKNFWTIVKFMYKDKVDLFMHLFMVVAFIWGFFNNTDMMAAVGFFGVYAFGATFRQAYWKKLYKEDVIDKQVK